MSNDPTQLRRKHLRAQGFDYAEPGSYFVTICVDRMESRFGRVEKTQVHLNEAGTIIHDTWMRIPSRFQDVTLDAFIIMPNHLHGIVCLQTGSDNRSASLSNIVQAFKSESTVEYGRGVKAGRFPRYERALWQRGFHDKILRDDRMLEAARLYIEANPGRWELNRTV
jgi:REP element-mobilizing transposase RayT